MTTDAIDAAARHADAPVIKARPLDAARSLDPLEPSEEWLALRRQIVGSSDIAAAVRGGDMYGTPAGLWLRKTRGGPPPQNNAMLAGMWLQPHIEELALDEIRQRYPAAERMPGAEITYEALNMPGMTCTPDMLVATNEDAANSKRGVRGLVVECKFVSDMSSFHTLSERTLRQLQHQLAVMDDIYGCTDYEDELAWADRETHGGFDWAGAVAVFPLADTDAPVLTGTPVLLSPTWLRPSRALLAEMETAGAAMLRCLREGISPLSTDAPDYYSRPEPR